jgi:integrase
MRPCDVDMSADDVWMYRPERHKLSYRGSDRVIALGPRSITIVREFLTTRTDAYLFSPVDAERDRLAAMRLKRNTKVPPSQVCRKKRRPRKRAGERYSSESYAKAIRYGCKKAGIPAWAPNRIRHSFASDVRKKYGIEPVQALLGHARLNTSEIYARKSEELMRQVAAKIG